VATAEAGPPTVDEGSWHELRLIAELGLLRSRSVQRRDIAK
jgi:hypothetical protein